MKDGYGSPYIKAFTSLGEINHRIVDFAYKFSQKGDDVCQIRIESDDQDLPDHPIFQEGVEYTVVWGYIGESEKQKRVLILRNIKPGFTEEGISMDLLFTNKASLIKTNSSKRVYNSKSVKDIAEDIAIRNGLSVEILAAPTALSTPTPDLRVYETLPQANRSDHEILKEAADNDPAGPFEIVGRDNKITVQKPNFNQKPLRKYKWKGEDGELLQFVPETKEYFVGAGHLGISTTTVDPKTKTFENTLITEGNNGMDVKLNDQINSPNYDEEDDGPGVLTQVASFISDTVDDLSHIFDSQNPTNDPTKPTKRPIPIKQDNTIKGNELTDIGVNKDGDKSVNPLKAESFDTYIKDTFGSREFRYSVYNPESPSFVNNSGFTTTAINSTAVQSKRPYIPTYLTGQHSPSVDDNHKDASGKAASVQHKKSLEKNPATAKVVGNVILESGKILTIEHVSRKFSGNYYIQESTHRLKPGDWYFVDMEFVRNAVGKVAKQPKNTVDVSSKYAKRGTNLLTNKQQGSSTNETPKKQLQLLSPEKPHKPVKLKKLFR